MKWLWIICVTLWPMAALCQTSEVFPGELVLSVDVEAMESEPMVGEQILVTIRGAYRRHITLEKLVQPRLEGFNWAQLGPDSWTEERIDGKTVKIFKRRMALYPDKPGTLRIAPFVHELTLTDEGDDWFPHAVRSDPLEVTVGPAPDSDEWWFPVRRLEISDQWSNAPDQLKPGEGVLRIIRVEAHGVTPEMIPPMPELTSPSAMIFPHPEQRLAELTPDGPVTYAFWRWTIRPTNDISTIVEPITVKYFDTTHRVAREVTISPQRVAYGDVTPSMAPQGETALPVMVEAANLPGIPALIAGLLTFAGTLFFGLRGVTFSGHGIFDPVKWRLLLAAWRGDASLVRRLANSVMQSDAKARNTRRTMLAQLDHGLFAPVPTAPDLPKFVMRFLRAK